MVRTTDHKVTSCTLTRVTAAVLSTLKPIDCWVCMTVLSGPRTNLGGHWQHPKEHAAADCVPGTAEKQTISMHAYAATRCSWSGIPPHQPAHCFSVCCCCMDNDKSIKGCLSCDTALHPQVCKDRCGTMCVHCCNSRTQSSRLPHALHLQ